MVNEPSVHDLPVQLVQPTEAEDEMESPLTDVWLQSQFRYRQESSQCLTITDGSIVITNNPREFVVGVETKELHPVFEIRCLERRGVVDRLRFVLRVRGRVEMLHGVGEEVGRYCSRDRELVSIVVLSLLILLASDYSPLWPFPVDRAYELRHLE